jgi:hypothetical protein
MALALMVVETPLAIVRLPPDAGLPWWAAGSAFLSLTMTPDETSIVCDTRRVPAKVTAERGYRALRVLGRLPFEATGVLAALTNPLAAARVPVFVVSTYDTDYILVREAMLPLATESLRKAGHSVTE